MREKITKYFSSQIQEIQNSFALRVYGAFLSLNYILAISYWYQYNFKRILASETPAICWPQWHDCQYLRIFNEATLPYVFAAFALLALFCGFLFLRKYVRSGYFLLILLEIIKFYFISLDFQVRMNQHYMSFFALLFFILVPGKKYFSRYVIVAFYFFAGLLKIKPEWINGEAIYGRLLLVPDEYKSPAAIYVIFLEIFIVWGLLSKNKWIFWLTLFQFYLFHLTSFTVVGSFYPMLMYSILMIFPLVYFENRQSHTQTPRGRLGFVMLVMLGLLNIWPKLIPGDTSVTGEGRLVALHMFDSKIYCDSKATLRFKNNPPVVKDLFLPVVMRIRCDPIIFVSQLRRLCRELKPHVEFEDIEWHLKSGKSATGDKETIVHITDYCAQDPDYSIWGNNSWIRK